MSAEEKVVDLMAALEESVAAAKTARRAISAERYCISADDCEADHHLYACPNYERDEDA